MIQRLLLPVAILLLIENGPSAMNRKVKGLIFDLNGTMVDDMLYHIEGWHELINAELGKKMSREEVKREMYGKSSEVLSRIFGEGYFSQKKLDEMSIEKEKRYQKAFKPKLALINGLHNLLESANQKNISMGIGSAAIMFNIDFVLDNLNIRHYFKAIVSADNVERSKPDPETYLKAALLMNIAAEDCIVFEDAPKGVEAALNGGMQCIVITTMHTREEFARYPNILRFIEDYADPFLREIF